MHEESPVYCQFDPDCGYVDLLCNHLIENDQFGYAVFDNEDLVGVMLGQIGNIPFTLHKVAQECVLYLHPSYRGGRIGLKLIDKFEKWAAEHEIETVMVGVSVDINSQMVNDLYRRLGYTDFSNSFRKHLN